MSRPKTGLLLVILLSASAWTQQRDITVGVYYYPWYGPGAGGHGFHSTLREHLVPKQRPALGYYNSTDAEVIAAHIQQSVRANIHFWACSWWGPGSFEDTAIRSHILAHASAGGLKYAILYESTGRLGSFSDPDYSRLLPDFTYLSSRYFNHPHYLRIDGRPVVFIYLTRVYFRNQGDQALADLRAAFPTLYIVADDVFGRSYKSSYAAKWDAVTAYDVYGQTMQAFGSTQAALSRLEEILNNARAAANGVNVGLIPFACPGFNDRGVRAGHPGAPRYFQDDRRSTEGDFFRSMLRDVVVPQADPLAKNMLMITSFNEWHEDTQIEPTAGTGGTTALDDSPAGTDYTQADRYTDYGHLYVDILRQETCNVLGDLDHNYHVDVEDLLLFALRWMDTDCDSCGGSDLDGDAAVNAVDLEILAGNWLTEKCYTYLRYTDAHPRPD
ncbi:MAG: glycoside hydrolase family 99-like domain-containing protein [Phycisphaerales bacterium]|nr:MAG: glycoside hydrolase family 99-like domain-containing protein [Phycisphaerales bacterium]